MGERLLELFPCKEPHASQAAAIPEKKVSYGVASPLEGYSETEMFAVRRFGHQHDAGHPRLKDDGIVPVQVNHYPFAKPSDLCDLSSLAAASKHADRWLNENPFPAASPAGRNCRNPVADKGGHASAHGLDFRQFGHEDAWQCGGIKL
jgi:hypothetical protein